jgi:hypothetical protein
MCLSPNAYCIEPLILKCPRSRPDAGFLSEARGKCDGWARCRRMERLISNDPEPGLFQAVRLHGGTCHRIYALRIDWNWKDFSRIAAGGYSEGFRIRFVSMIPRYTRKLPEATSRGVWVSAGLWSNFFAY